jgi:hypothetical protein
MYESTPIKPSWMRWPPNCCETCAGWDKQTDFTGLCVRAESKNHGDITESRQRCAGFRRKADD